jgi:beta-glucosidase
VSYPFGYGLSYTEFGYADLDESDDGVSVTVTNTGPRPGAEVVQLYVSDLESSVARPEQELKAFEKVFLRPGESRRVTLRLDDRAFAFWHPAVSRWVVEGGRFEVRVGASSRDIRLRVEVERGGEAIVAPLTIDSPAADWWDHPVVGERVRAAITGRYGRLLADPKESPLFRPIPLSRMIRFPGFTLREEQALAWAAEVA